ncbi:MAG: YbhB/YbcL family Raf kinase inhibitor-like protein [Phycisphaerales bacterium]
MNRKTFILISLLVLLYGFERENRTVSEIKGDPNMVKAATIPITVKSSAFQQDQMIPARYTCDGENISPPLKWGEIPIGTQSIALICEDPDAPMGTWTHWLMWNVPGNKTELEENIPKVGKLPDGVCQGINSGKKVGYTGPCPPDGTHRYYFNVYALDSMLSLSGDVSKEMLLEAMNGHVIAEGSLMGTYQRK